MLKVRRIVCHPKRRFPAHPVPGGCTLRQESGRYIRYMKYYRRLPMCDPKYRAVCVNHQRIQRWGVILLLALLVPLSVRPQNVAWAAVTPTITPPGSEQSRTPTPTQYNPYPSSQQTPGFQQPLQQTAISPPNAQEQPPSGILTDTVGVPVSGTATLIPLPEITMQFPSLSVSQPAIPTPPTMPPATISDFLPWITPTRVLIVLFLIFVWLFLGGWFYSTIRRLE
jgi:hypothetical protein